MWKCCGEGCRPIWMCLMSQNYTLKHGYMETFLISPKLNVCYRQQSRILKQINPRNIVGNITPFAYFYFHESFFSTWDTRSISPSSYHCCSGFHDMTFPLLSGSVQSTVTLCRGQVSPHLPGYREENGLVCHAQCSVGFRAILELWG